MTVLQRHILYIEDHEDTRELVSLLLEESNYRVTTACSVKDALNLAREGGFDLYIIDSWLPDGTGIEFCQRLREFDPGTPIMFLSAAAYDTDIKAAMDNGALRYLVKPTDLQLLSNEVSALIGSSNKYNQAGKLACCNSKFGLVSTQP
ncbi:MAG TPA: response regulator [Pyrinomonadaceae bacterium]|nr:response regulator [Pyrinomonadaceae bacterium]